MTAYDWANPSAGGNFSDPSNWVIAENGDPATNPPGPGDTAIIDNNAGITVTMGGATVEWLSIGPIGSGTYLDGSFDVTSGLNAGQGVVLENGSVSAGQIVGITNQNDTINANILSNSTILGGTVNVSTFQSSTVSSGTVNADEISSASIFGGTVTAGIFDDDVIGGGTVSGYSLMNGSISGGTVTLTGGLGFVAVSGGNVQCETLDGPITLLGGTISADDDYPSPSLEIYVSSGALTINSMELAAYASATITDGTLTVSGPLSVFSQLVQGFPAVGRLTVDGSGSAIIEGQATIANGAYILVGSVLPYLPEGYLQLDSGLSIAGTGLTFLEVMADGDADIGGNTTVDGSQASISVTRLWQRVDRRRGRAWKRRRIGSHKQCDSRILRRPYGWCRRSGHRLTLAHKFGRLNCRRQRGYWPQYWRRLRVAAIRLDALRYADAADRRCRARLFDGRRVGY